MGELEGGSIWGGSHNFISLGAPKGHNPDLIVSTIFSTFGLSFCYPPPPLKYCESIPSRFELSFCLPPPPPPTPADVDGLWPVGHLYSCFSFQSDQ